MVDQISNLQRFQQGKLFKLIIRRFEGYNLFDLISYKNDENMAMEVFFRNFKF